MIGPPVATVAVAAPRLGNWEGTGSKGVRISFRLVRSGKIIGLAGDHFTWTLPTQPALCPPGPHAEAAVDVPGAGYTGPGAPPLPVFHYKPRHMELEALQSFTTVDGTLRNRRTMVLHTDGPPSQPRGCGWPKHLKYVVHPRPRPRVADGQWTGTLSGPSSATGTVTADVQDGGHILDFLGLSISCPNQSPADTSYPGAEVFVRPNGSFVGPVGLSTTVNGVHEHWRGRFSAGTLRGALHTVDVCGDDLSPATLSFTAQHG